MIAVSPEENAWLDAFFGPGNAVRWKAIVSDAVAPHFSQHIIPWLEFLEQKELRRPLVLPVFGPNGPVRWYGVAGTSSELAQLGEELQSFLGSGFTDLNRTPTAFDASDPTEAALRVRFGPTGFKFSLGSGVPPGEVERRIQLYAAVLSRRPQPTNRGRRPFGRIRADFDAAVLAGNEVGARTLIDELGATGRLSADQRKSLEIRLYTGLGRYEELALNRDLIDAVIDLPLSAQTLADLVVALYKTHIEPLVAADTPYGEIVTAFKARISQRYGPLFRERKGLLDPDVLRSFILFEASTSPVNIERCASIVDVCPEGSRASSWLSSFLDWLKNKHRTDAKKGTDDWEATETQVRLAIGDEDFQRAFKLCLTLPRSGWVYRSLVRCAFELGEASLGKRVLEILGEATGDDLSAFGQKDHDRVLAIRSLVAGEAAPPRPKGWVPFAEWIQRESPSLATIQEQLKESVARWSPEQYATHSASCEDLARLIGNSSGTTEESFRFIFSDLVEFFVERPQTSSRAFGPVYAVLVNVLARSESVTKDELELVLDILRALFDSAPSASLYEDVIEDSIELLNANISPSRIDWALAMCELAAFYPAQSAEARLRLFTEVAGKLSHWSHRLSKAQAVVFQTLASDFQCGDLASSIASAKGETADDLEIEDDYEGQVAIYTLAERAGQYARKALLSLFPKAQVVVNSDHVATDALRSLARTARVFVFSWKKATHPAFYCVRDIRGLDRIVHPDGGGAASIIRAVIDEISRQSVRA